ncbi:MAG: hypothetical protein BWK76_05355 [Desulfobulbaceae bacterium A2]|nr:MAG: hypothetical protein BWK76_05355 [Desulfobulbaceae bacterium A2]
MTIADQTPCLLKTKVNIKKNRLQLTVGGTITEARLDAFYTDIRFGVADLQPGFAVITDLTACNYAHLSCVPAFRKIMHYLLANKVGNVVRVMSQQNLIFRQILNLTARFHGYKVCYVSSMEEAEQYLDQAQHRQQLRFCIRQEVGITVAGQRTTGSLIDISTSGCAIEAAGALPDATEIFLELNLGDGDKTEEQLFVIKAEVTRSDENGFATKFLDFSDSDQERLHQCLVKMVQHEEWKLILPQQDE